MNRPRIVTAEMQSHVRHQEYQNGGILFVTSRILVVDLLTSTVPTHLVSGILVANAHRVTATSSEAFILRLYRAENRTGFIKAVSDVPETLSRGLFKLDKTMKALWITKVHLWPRFQRTVTESLAKHPPEVIECRVKPSEKSLAIQNAIRELMYGTIPPAFG